jgi:putative ABC transport system permease protein
VLTSALAQALRVKTGDVVNVSGQTGARQLRVGALTDEMMSAVAYVPLADARAWLGQPGGGFNGLYVTAAPAAAPAVQAALYRLGAAGVQSKAALEQDWQSLFGLFYALVGAILAFAVAMAFALLFTTMTANVLERQRELATMRAVGADRGMIGLLLGAESLTLWLLATVPGLLLGSWVAARMGAAFQSDLFAFHITTNPATAAAAAAGILATMLLAALPAIRHANRLNLAEATKVLG